MSHYKPYPAYKDLDAQWLGAIPIHWNASSLKWKTKRFAGGTPDKTNSRYWEDGTIPWLASGEVNQKLVTQPTTHITEDAYKNSSAKWIPSGSLVMALAGQGKTRGTIAQLAIDSTCNQSMAAIVPNGINARFLYWWLESNYSNLRGLSGDDVRDGLNLEVLGQITCPLPASEEQEAISGHLDRETTRIDALVEKKTRFIELLREKRQALITHAVTKGLDPKVKMKDSGVEWLGYVPEHWDIKPIKWLSPVQRGASPRPIDDSKYFDDEGKYGWVRIEDVSSSNGYLKETKQKLSELGASLSVKLPIGSLFLSIAGSVGKPCISEINSCIHDGFVYFPLLKTSPKWLFRIFESKTPFVGLGKLGTQLNLNTETVGNIFIGVPPVDEIEKILEHLTQQLVRVDTVISKSERSIELLKERRSALITAAVTGQIDLREAA